MMMQEALSTLLSHRCVIQSIKAYGGHCMCQALGYVSHSEESHVR